MSAQSNRLTARETVIYAMMGALMFVSKILMEALPNIHLLGMLVMTCTVAFRKKALYPIYVYVLLNGVFAGFNMWWIPYLYIWTVLWGVTMLLPRTMSRRKKRIVYPLVCCAHGLLFGTLYAPAQALFMGLNFQGMLAWIAAGFPFDLLHGAGNLAAGLLILPCSELLIKLSREGGPQGGTPPEQ